MLLAAADEGFAVEIAAKYEGGLPDTAASGSCRPRLSQAPSTSAR